MAKKENLTHRQRKFVECYIGNATEAAKKAGYGGDEMALSAAGCRLLKSVKIQDALLKRKHSPDQCAQKEVAKHIATREERQRFWTETMKGKYIKDADKLKASELLGRSEGDFLDKVQHAGDPNNPVQIVVAPKLDLSKLSDEELEILKRAAPKLIEGQKE